MTLVPETSGFVEQVQAFFLAFRGSGVSVSPLDADLLLAWAERGVPYHVVCRGIRLAAEAKARDARRGEEALRSLRAARAAVEKEFRRYQGRSAGRSATPEKTPAEAAASRLKAAAAKLRKLTRETANPARARAGNAALKIVLAAARDDPSAVSQAVARADDTLAIAYVRNLPWMARRDLVRSARRNAGPRSPGATPRARRDAMRAHLVAVARSEGNLVTLV